MRQYILDVACRGTVTFEPGQYAELTESTVGELNDLAADGLLTWNAQRLQVTASGKHFIRNICKAFDLKLLNSDIEKKTFSQAV
jgi:oxygen-independent coproporphyrinogen-3 oxidase